MYSFHRLVLNMIINGCYNFNVYRNVYLLSRLPLIELASCMTRAVEMHIHVTVMNMNKWSVNLHEMTND